MAVLLLLILALVFAAGYATQRGSTCAVVAAEELVRHRRAARMIGFLFCAALALLVLAAGRAVGLPVLERYPGSTEFGFAVLGGAVFATGAFVNERCAFGTVARLGSGELRRIGTILGFLGGAWFAIGAGMFQRHRLLTTPLAMLPEPLVVAGAAGLAAALGWALVRAGQREPVSGEWSPLQAMAAIGLSNGLLLVLAQGWPYTNLLLDIAGADTGAFGWRLLMCGVFVGGAVGAALLSRRFALDYGTALGWAKAIGGGAMMGAGATLVPGGNDTMLLVGLPLLLPNLIVAYVVMMAMLIGLAMNSERTHGRSVEDVLDD